MGFDYQKPKPAKRPCGLKTATVFWAIAAAALSTAADSALAQDTQLSGIVVESASQSQDKIDIATLGTAATVVTGEQLQQRQIRHAADALRSVPGVSVSRTGAFGGLTQVRIRGAEANHTLVLIDGIEINRTTDGFFDFASLLAEDIERIEVLRGPQSGVWGSNALAGVINIVTSDGKGPAQVRARAEGGSFETRSGNVSLRGGNDRAHGLVSLTSRETRGDNVSNFGFEDDGSRQVNVRAKGGAQLTDALSIDAKYHRLSNLTDIDGLFGAAPGAGPGTFGVTLDQLGATNETETEVWGTAAHLNFFDDHWKNRIYINDQETSLNSINPAFGNTNQKSDQRQYGVVSTLRLETPGLLNSTHELTGMLENEDEGFLPSSDFVRRTRNVESYVGEYRGEVMNRLFVNGAIRHDDSNTFKDFTTYKVAGALLIPETGTRPHASYGTGVVFPTMFEQFGLLPGFFVPNPNLLPEESEGWDAGLEQTFFGGALVVDVTYFEQNLLDEIVSVPAGFFLFTSANLVGESTRDGIEVAATAKPTDRIEISGSYTYLDAHEPDSTAEIRRPAHSGSVHAALRFADGRGLFDIGAEYNGKMQDIVFDAFTFAPSTTTLDDFVLLKLAVQYDVDQRLQLFGRVENALDEDYEEVFSFNTPGIAAYGGVRVKFSTDDPPLETAQN
jgi:vitamin B12 transporter